MISNTYSIQIPTPCHEDWQQMAPGGDGRFCERCSKTVIDFTALSDQEIIGLLQQRNEKLCGRFRGPQLNRRLEETTLTKQPATRLRRFIAAAILLFSFREVTAGLPARTQITISPELLSKRSNGDKDSIKETELRGWLIDSVTQEPIGFASIENKRTHAMQSSDQHGDFSIPAKTGDTLSMWYLGYHRCEFTVKSLEPRQYHLVPAEKFLQGDIIITGRVIKQNKIRPMDKIKRFFGIKKR